MPLTLASRPLVYKALPSAFFDRHGAAGATGAPEQQTTSAAPAQDASAAAPREALLPFQSTPDVTSTHNVPLIIHNAPVPGAAKPLKSNLRSRTKSASAVQITRTCISDGENPTSSAARHRPTLVMPKIVDSPFRRKEAPSEMPLKRKDSPLSPRDSPVGGSGGRRGSPYDRKDSPSGRRPSPSGSTPSPRPNGYALWDTKTATTLWGSRPGSGKRDSPSPRPGTEALESPSPRDGPFGGTFTVISPRLNRSNSRTTLSLDNVDLWEDISDSEDVGFDEINGVRINPSKTFDFSELRKSQSPVECKRNKMEKDLQENVWKRTGDKDSVVERISSRRIIQGRISPRGASKVSPRGVVSSRVSPRSSSGRRISPGGKISPRMSAGKKSPRDTKSSVQSEDTSYSGQQHDLKNGWKLNSSAKRETVASKLLKQSQQRASLLSKRQSENSSNTNFSLYRLKEETASIEKGQSSSERDTDSDSSAGSWRRKGDCKQNSDSVERRVKFNDVVMIQDGDSNSYDSLRHSNNSAQFYKKQFL